MAMNPRRRITARKRLIDEIFAADYGEKPVPLEELRWKVFLREREESRREQPEMNISYTKSFSRSIRDHIGNLEIYSIRRADRTPVGIVARAAAYRCTDYTILTQITETSHLSVYIQFKGNRHLDYN